MIVYVLAALAAAFYLCAVPVRAALEVRPGHESQVRLWLGLFGRVRVWTWLIELKRLEFTRRRAKLPQGLVKAARYLYRRTSVDRLEARLALGDACATALASGVLLSVLSFVSRRARVWPLFGAERAQLSAVCIVTARLGHIMFAALYAAWIWIVWRLRSWIKGRSKASWPLRWNPFATWSTSTR